MLLVAKPEVPAVPGAQHSTRAQGLSQGWQGSSARVCRRGVTPGMVCAGAGEHLKPMEEADVELMGFVTSGHCVTLVLPKWAGSRLDSLWT